MASGSPDALAGGMSNPYAHFVPSGIGPRIGPTGFTVGIFTMLGISTVTIIARMVLRLQRSRSLAVDDYFLIVALCTLIGAVSTQQYYREITFMTINVETGNMIPPETFPVDSLKETQVLDASSVLLWASIFCVKFSFLFFFRKLISRVRNMQIYWWVVFGIVLPSALVSIPLGFIECTYFGLDLLDHCPVDSLIRKEHIYLDVTVVLDIFTDVLIISLPIALLWNVKIELAKKLTLLGIFGLSIVMIIIALIRVTMAPLTPMIIDTTWLFFWQIMEASIALVMVSVSAFRGLFGQAGSPAAYDSHKGLVRPHNKGSSPSSATGNNPKSKSHKSLKDMISAPTSPKMLASFTPRRSIDNVPLGQMQGSSKEALTGNTTFEMTSVTLPRAGHSSVTNSGFPRSASHSLAPLLRPMRLETTYAQPTKELSPKPGTPGTPAGFERAASPITTRVWADGVDSTRGKGERTRSLTRGGSVLDRARRGLMGEERGRGRAPSVGDVLIEGEENGARGRASAEEWV